MLFVTEDEVVKSTDVCEIFGVVGAPTIIIVHPEGKVQARTCLCIQQSYRMLDTQMLTTPT